MAKPKMNRKELFLAVNKYLCYLVNACIVGALVGGIGFFFYGLFVFSKS
jgi:hypothetical protein